MIVPSKHVAVLVAVYGVDQTVLFVDVCPLCWLLKVLQISVRLNEHRLLVDLSHRFLELLLLPTLLYLKFLLRDRLDG